ncbi:hypothetical protein QUF95_15390 [Paenibacillus silvae]|uniref:hypothetical protein n=1 Tax=Paenibacillus silvae TaxID=1325358 RepID=UPI0025A15014|nr:hypothetical protein [Paenibacillus silvae]MDM5278781.1 hypothetical protein [Paenibacillus silvae]
MEIWPGWNSTTKNGVKVLVTPAGKVFRKEDIDPNPDRFNQTELARAMGISTAAIRDRISRGTLPEYDGFTAAGRGYWMAGTVKHLIGGENKQ